VPGGGQSPFYTSFNTVKNSRLDATRLNEAVQVGKHPAYGYKPQVRAYRATQDVRVPAGKATANPTHGPGGGDQVFIENFKNVLQPIRDFNLSNWL
jgi:filamentous hemagglutinin